jgi:hypothetical protein
VAMIETMDMRAAVMGCRVGSVGMWNGMGTGVAHQAGWDASLHATCVERRCGKLRARQTLPLKQGLVRGMRWVWAWEHCPDGHRRPGASRSELVLTLEIDF